MQISVCFLHRQLETWWWSGLPYLALPGRIFLYSVHPALSNTVSGQILEFKVRENRLESGE